MGKKEEEEVQRGSQSLRKMRGCWNFSALDELPSLYPPEFKSEHLQLSLLKL